MCVYILNIMRIILYYNVAMSTLIISKKKKSIYIYFNLLNSNIFVHSNIL